MCEGMKSKTKEHVLVAKEKGNRCYKATERQICQLMKDVHF